MAIETSGDVCAWLRAANPLSPSRTPEATLTAARVGALALGVYALSQWGKAVAVALWPDVWLDASMAAFDRLGPPEATAAARELLNIALLQQMMANLVFGVLAAGLAALQWFRPGAILPAILALMLAWGLLGLLATAAMGLAPPLSWPLYGTLPASFAALVLALAGLRGGLALGRMKRRTAQPA